ncbi:TPA_asm: RNA-directed RNA polymerase [ssRNA phage SRR7976301_7]|uniref:RNA-directed RNA polymerase n=1 Tax=ssRNA phage SRR7976301_7 TaxID=2786668 RepID=A0A8S5L4P6_9VIRU|nr:RNA-directed RNA polymerase [ssRNA phage SRR7976301_7]DAD52678.1 TPA_asm: RNA-directed RNA polymerase [ssRNA phage SRR7976301_7]
MHKQKLKAALGTFPRETFKKCFMSFAKSFYESIDSDVSRTCLAHLEKGEYDQLVNMEVDPDNYTNPQKFADDYQAVKLLSKYKDFTHVNLKPEEAARKSFMEYEAQCAVTNKRFLELSDDPSKWDPTMRFYFQKARRKISDVLGKVDLQRLDGSFGWGPGATTSASGRHTSAYVKFTRRLDVTSNCLAIGHACINGRPSWVRTQLQIDDESTIVYLTKDAFNVVRGNKIVFVDKNAKTKRTIAIEPHMNSYIQKGFGLEMRRKLLRRAGIDLRNQSRNQQLARQGSITGLLCTMDLKGASDTIAKLLVKYLLPYTWFALLDMCRSKQGFLDGTWLNYEKFSSMGNGFTFELESLIFWALVSSVCESLPIDQSLPISVYGDDLIFPSAAYEKVEQVLAFAGFSVNNQKSFSSGPFRESCGRDYFLGHAVRPIFLKEIPSNAERVFKLANSVRRYSHSRNLNCGCDRRFRTVWLGLVQYVPASLRYLKIPEGYGDGGLVVDFDEARPSRARNGWEGFEYKSLVRKPVKHRKMDWTSGLTTALSVVDGQKSTVFHWGLHSPDWTETMPSDGFHSLRRSTVPKVARCHARAWHDLGAWQ